MHIIIRACGERTEEKCIESARNQGTVHIIREIPFGESIRKTYERAIELNQKWIPVIDADVILKSGTLKAAIQYLEQQPKNTFCLDGKTKDKIMCCTRRAGVHIYRTSMLEMAKQFIDNNQLKPESHVRRSMSKLGYPTTVGKIVFGWHDYEQYYCDLWRKSFAQTRKLARKIKNSGIINKWKRLSKTDEDYQVILLAHIEGNKYKGDIVIDKNIDFNAKEFLTKYGIKEKMPL
jgi:hypothetical protein